MNIRERYVKRQWQIGADKVKNFIEHLKGRMGDQIEIEYLDSTADCTEWIENKQFEDSTPDILIKTSDGCKILIEVTGSCDPIPFTSDGWVRKRKLERLFELCRDEDYSHAAVMIIQPYEAKTGEVRYIYRCFWASDYFQNFIDGEFKLQGVIIDLRPINGIQSPCYVFPFNHSCLLQSIKTIYCKIEHCLSSNSGIHCPNDCSHCDDEEYNKL